MKDSNKYTMQRLLEKIFRTHCNYLDLTLLFEIMFCNYTSPVEMPIIKATYDLPPLPIANSWCIKEATEIALHLKEAHGARKWHIDCMVGMFDESYLISLPRLQIDTSELVYTSFELLWWLWYTWGATLLG